MEISDGHLPTLREFYYFFIASLAWASSFWAQPHMYGIPDEEVQIAA